MLSRPALLDGGIRNRQDVNADSNVPSPHSIVASLLTDARGLKLDYDAAFRGYLRTMKGASVIDALLDLEGLPQDIVGEWENSSQFSPFEQRFSSLFDRCGSSLLGLVYANGKSVAESLGSVAQATHLETKLRRLVTALESASITEIRVRPAGRLPRRRKAGSARGSQGANARHQGIAWSILGTLIGVFALVLLITIASLGLSEGLEVGGPVGLVVCLTLWFSRGIWGPRLSAVGSAGKR